MENNENKVLERKAKAGWRCYFLMRDMYCELSASYINILNKNSKLVKKLKDNEEIDLSYLKSQFIELYDLVKGQTECPICFDEINRENIDVKNCGHIICKKCVEEIKNTSHSPHKCPICRKNI